VRVQKQLSSFFDGGYASHCRLDHREVLKIASSLTARKAAR